MRRPPSYSDSFIVRSPSIQAVPILEPLFLDGIAHGEEAQEIEKYDKTCDFLEFPTLFVIKGSLHIFFISVFETAFYFLYISQSENAGILRAIDAYYQPLIASCSKWPNTTRELILDVMKFSLNKSQIDSDGLTSNIQRTAFNRSLLNTSIWYSGACVIAFCMAFAVIRYKGIEIKWRPLILEHLAFIGVLALYEYFFYITIIYNYTTISTPEINRYIVDGLFQCTAASNAALALSS